MATPASAYPRLSNDGLSVVAGDRVLVKDRSVELGSGIGGQFGADGWIYFGGHDGVFRRWRNGVIEVVRSQGFNVFVIAGERWIGWRAGEGLTWHDGVPWLAWHSPALSETRWAAILDRDGSKVLHAGRGDGQDGHVVAPSAERRARGVFARDPVLRGELLTWVEEDPNTRELSVWGQDGHKGPIQSLTIPGNTRQGYIVPVEIDGQPWALSHDDTRVMLYRWGAFDGYVVAHAPAHRPDGRQLPDRSVRIVYDAEHNVLGDVTISTAAPRIDLRVTPRQAEEDTSGQPVDLWAFFLPSSSAFPRTSDEPGHGHEMHCIFDGRNFWTLPFGEPDHWVRMVVDGDTLTFREDRSRDGQSTGDYSFTHGLWARRFMRVGDRIVNARNNLVRYQPDGCRIVDVHAFAFRTGLWKHWTSYDCGGDLGWQDVIAYLYDPGGLADTYELSYFARGFGFFRWEEYDQRTDQRRHWTTFNQFGGRAPQPTPGCWKREHLDLTPSNWQSPPQTPDPPTPIPVPTPEPVMSEVSLQTFNRTNYIVAEDGGGKEGEVLHGRPSGLARADRVAPGAWETFLVRKAPDGRVGFRAPNGGWLSAQPDGTLVFNRHRGDDWTPEAWEAFRIEPGLDGGISLVTDHGTRVRAINTGGSELRHDARDAAGIDETFFPSVSLTGGSSVGGGTAVGGGLQSQQVTADPHGGLLVGGRPALITSVHDGSGLSQFFYNPEEFMRRARMDAANRFMLRRTWWDVDGPYWEGRQLQGHWPDGNRVLTPDKYGEDTFIRTCVAFLKFHEEIGMAVHIGRGTWTSTNSDRMAEIVREIIRQAGVHTIGIGEGVNEQDAVTPHTSIDEITRFRDRAYEGVALVCNTAIAGLDFEAQLVNEHRLREFNPGATIIPFHGYRGAGWMNKLERDWNVRYEWGIGLAVDAEGVGVGPYVSAADNLHELNGAFFQIRHALEHACGYIPTLMSGPGVIPDGSRSEPWGTQVGYDKVCQVRDWLPADAGHFRDVFHGGDRWGDKRYFRAIGDTRVEHHIEPETQRGIIIAYGDEAAHIPMHRHFNIENDVWIEEGHIKGRVIVGRG